MENDWDNLIILDACRPRFFEEYNPFDGEYSCKTSLGASSGEFFERNFEGNQYHDIVYVTGNTKIERINDRSLHRLVKTYADTINHHKGWLPKTTLDVALEVYNEHPNKRLVVHFMQPHAPYLSKQAKKLRERVTNEYNVGFGHMDVIENNKNDDVDEFIPHLLFALERGYITREELEEVYAENLRLVFDYVEELVNNIDGKTVVTSDHSESFGDFNGIYGHKERAFSHSLREVPWLVLDRSRRNTFAEPPFESISVDEDIIKENLRELGYV